jgi:hypothetical protein
MDNKTETQRSLVISFLLITISLTSCDQVESKFPDYNSADKAGFFDRGWIPENLISNSMTNIYQKTNLDLNTCVFSYSLLEPDLIETLAKVQQTNQKELPRGINIPKWWVNKVTTLYHYSIFDSNTNDSIYIAIDKKDFKIFGWHNGVIH